jgi:putative transposase
MRRKPVPRLRGFDYTGCYRYFLTICTLKRSPVFVTPATVDVVLVQLAQSAQDERMAVMAYCFMPDHLHVLVEGTDAASRLTEFVRIFRQRSAFHWKRTFGAELWQRGYFERVLRNDESTVDAARYVLANPLRAGMVETVEEYPFLGSLTMSVGDLLYSVSKEGC